MKLILSVLFTCMLFAPQEIDEAYILEIQEYQNELNKEFSDKETSPFTKKVRKQFNGLDFFPINKSYQIDAKFIRTENSTPFQMKTTTERTPTYEKYGEAYFEYNGVEYQLNIYQSHRLREKEEYKDYLFLPFTDATNGIDTYGGGRFIDLKTPNNNRIIIDFNKAYNPTCAYNHAYSCPIPPKENDLNLRVEAGVKKWDH